MESKNPNNLPADFSENPLETFDLGKLLFTLKKSIVWILIFVTLTVTGAYLIVRYTKPLYEASSVIKLDFVSEANTLGLVNTGALQNDLSGISGEIEILKSKLFLRRVVEAINYDVAYHFRGRYLTDERYNNSPFVISHKIKNPVLYDKSIDIEVFNDQEFEITHPLNGEKIRGTFGKGISTTEMNLLVEKTTFFNSSVSGTYYFVINSHEALIRYFERSCTVSPENFSAQTIRISLKDFNRIKARDFLTAVDTLYLEYTKEEKNKTIDQKITFLDKQIEETEKRIAEFEGYFEEIIIEKKTLSLEGDLARTLAQIRILDSTKIKIESRKAALEQIVNETLANGSFHTDPFTLSQYPQFLQKAIVAYQEQARERTEKLASYNENTHVIEQIDLRLSENKNTLLKSLSKYQSALDESQIEVRAKRRILEDNFALLPSMGTEFNKNQRLYALQESFILSLRETKMELELTKAGTVTNGILLSPASIPASPISPKKLLIIGAGALLSIFFSLIFVIVRYLLNNFITSAKELEKLSPAPILGSVPLYTKEKLPLTRLIVNKSSKSALSESLRTIRTNMDFLNVDKKVKTVTITSTISGEGKTFVAVNLGAIIASTDKKVCIVDLDLRKPKVHIAFEDEGKSFGTSTHLIGKNKFEDCIVSTEVENLYYIPAGPTPPNPSELVLSEKFNDFLARLQDHFDFIIFDTPPVGLVTDAILVMKKTDLQFYVVKSQYSRRAFAKTITDLVRVNKFHQMTVIFNGVKSGMNGYGYGYGYGSYGYGGYGYGYYEEGEKPKNKLVSFFRSLF